jgi:hypothetical protein
MNFLTPAFLAASSRFLLPPVVDFQIGKTVFLPGDAYGGDDHLNLRKRIFQARGVSNLRNGALFGRESQLFEFAFVSAERPEGVLAVLQFSDEVTTEVARCAGDQNVFHLARVLNRESEGDNSLISRASRIVVSPKQQEKSELWGVAYRTTAVWGSLPAP